jgi:Universal stress protein family
VREILRHAEDRRTDLLVMGTHGRSGFEALFLGSVTEKVLRSTHVPVLTVPPAVVLASELSSTRRSSVPSNSPIRRRARWRTR